MQRLALHTAAMSMAAVSLSLAGSATAADLRRPVPVKAPPPVAAASWTGCYLGAGGGYGMFSQRSRRVDNGVPFGQPNDDAGRGWFGTVQVGCDYQIGSNIVIGVFADYDWSRIEGNWTNATFSGLGDQSVTNSWAAGGRVGWLPYQYLLVFVSGGYTEARFSGFNFVSALSGAPTSNSVAGASATGWFVGAGYEYGITWFPGLFWKNEYRFADYGTANAALRANVLPNSWFELQTVVQTVRSELVWRFNWNGPLVAAAAADPRRSMPVKASPAVAPTPYNWTGCYLGAGGGYGLLDQETQRFDNGVAVSLVNDVGGHGWLATVQVGCDYQVASNIVIGGFADYDWSRIKGNWNSGFSSLVGRDERLENSWAVGGRAGWLPYQHLLVFVSGGYSQARFDPITLVTSGGIALNRTVAGHTSSGWFVGTGYEYALNLTPGLSWKTEYRLADYDSDNVALVNDPTPNAAVALRSFVHTARSELVWRFNVGGAAARY